MTSSLRNAHKFIKACDILLYWMWIKQTPYKLLSEAKYFYNNNIINIPIGGDSGEDSIGKRELSENEEGAFVFASNNIIKWCTQVKEFSPSLIPIW